MEGVRNLKMECSNTPQTELMDEGVCSDEKPYARQKNVPVIFITSDAEDEFTMWQMDPLQL